MSLDMQYRADHRTLLTPVTGNVMYDIDQVPLVVYPEVDRTELSTGSRRLQLIRHKYATSYNHVLNDYKEAEYVRALSDFNPRINRQDTLGQTQAVQTHLRVRAKYELAITLYALLDELTEYSCLPSFMGNETNRNMANEAKYHFGAKVHPSSRNVDYFEVTLPLTSIKSLKERCLDRAESLVPRLELLSLTSQIS
jgi:hypothetical protein